MVVDAKSQMLNRSIDACAGNDLLKEPPHAASVQCSSVATATMAGDHEASISHDGISDGFLLENGANDTINDSLICETRGHSASTLASVPSQVSTPQSSDVLFGTVTKQRWPGNSFFNRLVQRRRESGDLPEAAAEIVEHVRAKGGRFYYCSVVDGGIQYRLCTEEQTTKYTLRHLCSTAQSKTFSASTAAFLQALYSSPESSATPQVTPSPLSVKAEAIGILMGDADPTSSRMGVTAMTNENSVDGGDLSSSKQGHPPHAENPYGQMYPASYPYQYHPSHYPPPPYPYYPYHHYPHYPPPPPLHPKSKSKVSHTTPAKATKEAPDAKTDMPCDDELSEPDYQNFPEPSPMSVKSTSSSSSKSSKCKSSSPKARSSPASSPKTVGTATDLGRAECTIDPQTGIVHVGLPRGVTVRPSGKWQAQIYFAGRSRYIGVFEDPLLASVAYSVSYEMVKTLKSRRKEFDDDPRGDVVPESNRLFSVVRSLSNKAALLFTDEVGKLNQSTDSAKMQSIQAAYEFARQYVGLNTPKDFGL